MFSPLSQPTHREEVFHLPSAPSSLSPGILGLLAPSPIKGDNLFSADPSFTHWALLPLWPCLQPLGGKNEVLSSTQQGLPAPQNPPFPSSSPLSTHLMKTGPTGWRGKKKKVRLATEKRDMDPTSESHLTPNSQGLPTVTFSVFRHLSCAS